MVFFEIFNYYSISLFLGGIIALISGLLPYLDNSKKPENKAWLLLNASSAIWSFGYLSMITSTSLQSGLYSNYVLHGAASFIPLFYFLFILHLTNQFKRRKKIFFFSSFVALFFFIINPSTIFIKTVTPKFIFNYAPEPGFMYIYFTAYFFLLVTYSIYLLYNTQLHTKREETVRLRFVLFSSLAGFIGGGGVFLLTYNLIAPHLLILFAFYPAIITYAMIKHHLLNIKVILTEFFISLLWLLLLFRIFFFDTLQDQLIGFFVFFASLILGISVIKSVVKEVKTREEIERLAVDLEKANEKLKELDKLKSEFVSIASHQLRSPLTALKGYTSLLMEGSYGKLPAAAKEAVENIFESADLMVGSVEDFLNVSRIEQGRMKYEMSEFDIVELTSSVFEEQKNVADEKGVKLSFNGNGKKINIKADIGKIKQVFTNLIDNSIKYTPKGSITISIMEGGNVIRFSVKDTGIGMSKEDIGKLFKRFERAKGANLVNVSGTGLGLYVAKEMVEAHKGKIWAESEGKGLGSTFIVELPLSK